MTSNIIFLDFDGPLSNARVALQTGMMYWDFDPVTIGVLNNICDVSGAKIVCTSTRAGRTPENYKTVCDFFEKAGLDLHNLHEDWSCQYGLQFSREEHIRKWLANHPEVARYSIVDDEDVKLPNLVKVDANDGLLTDHFRAVAGHVGCTLGDVYKRASQKWEQARNPVPQPEPLIPKMSSAP